MIAPTSEYDRGRTEAIAAVEEVLAGGDHALWCDHWRGDGDCSCLPERIRAALARLDPRRGETLVATVVQTPGNEGAEYVIRIPGREEIVLGDAQPEYWALAAIIDGEWTDSIRGDLEERGKDD